MWTSNTRSIKQCSYIQSKSWLICELRICRPEARYIELYLTRVLVCLTFQTHGRCCDGRLCGKDHQKGHASPSYRNRPQRKRHHLPTEGRHRIRSHKRKTQSFTLQTKLGHCITTPNHPVWFGSVKGIVLQSVCRNCKVCQRSSVKFVQK